MASADFSSAFDFHFLGPLLFLSLILLILKFSCEILFNKNIILIKKQHLHKILFLFVLPVWLLIWLYKEFLI